ncbi:WhiB family transcriptional regulator [Actinopolymorpha sp. B11F2]|uniref:WhiB family transcriptional regulator n=1 Tax=Actinopolymorpha sp. B11F2 TaxID=3160862 RepID=UPI0032E4A00C
MTTFDVAAEPVEGLERAVLDEGAGARENQPSVPCRADRTAADDDPWFEPEPVATATRARTAYELHARRRCEPCLVREACLKLALRYESCGLAAWSVWGGTAPWTRQDILRARQSSSTIADVAAATDAVKGAIA